MFLLALAGLLVSGFLAYEYSLKGSITCPLTGLGCDIVRNSQYSRLFGVAVPYLGILYYLGMGIISIILLEKDMKIFKKLLFLGGIIGFVTSLYFTYLEAFIILAFCFWCITSAMIAALLFLSSGYIILMSKDEN